MNLCSLKKASVHWLVLMRHVLESLGHVGFFSLYGRKESAALPWQQKHPFKQQSSSDAHGFWYGDPGWHDAIYRWWQPMMKWGVVTRHYSGSNSNNVAMCESRVSGYFEFSRVDPFHFSKIFWGVFSDKHAQGGGLVLCYWLCVSSMC